MARQEQVSPEFDWKADFSHARAELESASSEAASALAYALISAFRMADICQRAISRGVTWQANSDTVADWQDFMETLSNDAEFLYPMHLGLLAGDHGDDLLAPFARIAETALEAQIRISAGPSSPEARKKTIVQLRNLMRSIQTAVAILDPFPGGEIADLPVSDSRKKREIIAPSEVALVPLVGRIAAGTPNTAEQEVEDIFPLPRQVVGEGDLFLLRVYGQSMVGAGIMERDWVAIRRQQVVENGEIVAAMIDGEATIKTYKKLSGKIWLLPHNSENEKIPGERAVIMGKVVAVFRKI